MQGREESWYLELQATNILGMSLLPVQSDWSHLDSAREEGGI